MGADTKMASMTPINFGKEYDSQKTQALERNVRLLYGAMRRVETLLLGGQPGQVLTKRTVRDFEGVWSEVTGGGGSGDVTNGESLGGAPVFAGKNGTVLQFKGLAVAGGLEISETDELITIGAGDTGGGVDPDELADVAFSGDYADLNGTPPAYLIQEDAEREWLAEEFMRGHNIIGVRTVGAEVKLPHDLEVEKIVIVKNETGVGGVTVSVY